MSHFHSDLHTKDMDTKRHGGGRSIATTSTTMGLGQQSTELPVVPHGLRNIFQATVTVEIQPWTGELLGNGCSDPAFRKFTADLNNNIKPVMDFMAKFPKPDIVFMQAFASGDICFSKEQSDQSALLFEELRRSKKVTVKAESIKQESVSVEASSSDRGVRPTTPSVQADGSDEESKDVELVLSFDNETQMRLASNYATKVHQTIRNFGVMAILRTIRADFKTATYPDGLHSHILQYMPDDPAHALKLIFGLKFQSKESSIVENILILSNLKLNQGGFGGVFNKFRDCQKQLSVLEPKLDLNILTLFLMCALETGWKSHHGSASEKMHCLAELNRKREDPHLSISLLQDFFEGLEALSPQDKLKADQPAPPNDFIGAVTGRGAGGKGGKGGKTGKGGNSRRLPLKLTEAPDQSNRTPRRNAEDQDKRVQPARVQQAQPREVCKKYFTGECDMQNCKSFHLYPCLFFYQKGRRCAKPERECGFSHEFDAAGLQNHAKLHKLDPTKFKLPAPPPSAGSEQIIQPILRAVDCRDCGQTHGPGKCKKKRTSFSGLAHAVSHQSAARDINRFSALINEHAGQDGHRSD